MGTQEQLTNGGWTAKEIIGSSEMVRAPPLQMTKGWRNNVAPFDAADLMTLCLEKALKADQFFYFTSTNEVSRPNRIWRREILLNGKKLGEASICLPRGASVWLCPYFDASTRTLRFRRRDGKDADECLDVYHMAQRKQYRPLLNMAQAEGLLDRIPGE